MPLIPSPPQTPSAPKPRAQTQELGIWEMNASSSGSVFVFPYQPHNDSAEMADNDSSPNDSTLPKRWRLHNLFWKIIMQLITALDSPPSPACVLGEAALLSLHKALSVILKVKRLSCYDL